MENVGVRRTAMILTALRVEYLAVVRHLNNVQEEVYKGTIYEWGEFTGTKGQWRVGITEIGAGNVAAAAESERAVNHFQPEIIFFIGVAGGLKDVRLGDVVVATKVYGYESGKAGETFLARPNVGNSAYGLVQRARAVARTAHWRQRLPEQYKGSDAEVHIGAIAAGEKVVSSTRSDTRIFLLQHYNDALAVEMEGYGFIQAIHANTQTEALIVRGVSDLIDGKSEADAANYQVLASATASAFAFEILATL